MKEAIQVAKKKRKNKRRVEKFFDYQKDPVGFGEKVLHETYTEDIKRVMESVRDNPVTIAQSSNAVGKTHAAARMAIWFYKCFPQSQVYTTAAPPYRNLQQLLWGEIMSIVEKHKETVLPYDRLRNLHISMGSQHFITGVAIPTSGTTKEREAKFCADSDDLFELFDGSIVRYGDLIGQKDVPVISVGENFERHWSDAEFFDNGKQHVFEIVLEDGEVIRRTGNHPFYAGWDIRPDYHTYGGKHMKGRIRPMQEGWRTVKELWVGNALLCPASTEFNFGIDEIDVNLLKFLAYMIGDGCFIGKSDRSNRLQFTQEDNPQLAEFRQILNEMEISYTVSDKDEYNWAVVNINNKELADWSRLLQLHGKGSGDKFIPDFVYRLTREQMSVFLNRLFSTDGWASLSNKAEIGYSSKSKRLVFDIQRLLRRFGIRSRIASRVTHWKNGEEEKSGTYWSLFINHANDIMLFAEQIGIYGKEEAVYQCYEYADGTSWPYANWKFEKSGYIWRRIKSMRFIGIKPTVGVHVPGDHTYLTSLVEHNSGKHAPYLLFIVDEGDAVPDEIYDAIESCTSGGIFRLLIMFNPRFKGGPVYYKAKNNLANVVKIRAFNHPNVITGKDIIPGAVTQEATIRRIHNWTRPLHPNEKIEADCFEVPEFLVGKEFTGLDGVIRPPLQAGFRKIEQPEFSYMVLGEYPAQSEMQLISQTWIDRARSNYDLYVAKFGELPPENVRPTLGVDIAELGIDYNIACLRYGSYVAPLIPWNGIDPDDSATKTYTLYVENNAKIAMIDGTGVGAGVAPRVARIGRENDRHDVRTVSVKSASAPSPIIKVEEGEFYMLRDQLWWAVREWLKNDPNAMLPNDPFLLEELAAPTYKKDLRGKIRVSDKDTLRDILRRSTDRADALCLTFSPFERAKVIGIDI